MAHPWAGHQSQLFCWLQLRGGNCLDEKVHSKPAGLDRAAISAGGEKLPEMTAVEGLGLFGGSFDPVHHGHLLVAQAACEELELSRLYFIPAAQSPFKPESC